MRKHANINRVEKVWNDFTHTMNFPLVSVIIPAYNAQNYIAETLESIMKQAWPNIEIIVVDDGSTDMTAKVVERYGSEVTYIHQANSGSCAAPRNRGLEHCHGRYVCFMDADDLMTSGRIAKQVDFLERHHDVGIVFSDYINFDDNGPQSSTHFATCPKLLSILGNSTEVVIDNACRLLIEENFGIASSFMIRLNMAGCDNFFDETLKASEDFHFYYRLARHTKTGVINDIGMMRRIHSGNMSSNVERMLINCILSYSLLRNSEQNIHARRLLSAFVATCWDNMARHKANHSCYRSAIRYQFKGLITDPGIKQFNRSLYGIARTLAIAIGLHRPKEH